MNRYDPERPSIFSRPDDEIEASAPHRSTPQGPARSSLPPVDEPNRPRPPAERAHDPGPFSRQVIVLASIGLAILALGGFIAASLLRDDGAGLAAATLEPTASASAHGSAHASASPAPSLEPTPDTTAVAATATPEPTPAGPPAELAVGGWATVAASELNVRDAPGLDARRLYGLVRGAIVHVAEGPVDVGGSNWYRVASLGGALGWSTSGPEASPFLQTVARGGDFLHCGAVTSAVFDGDDLDPIEVLRIDDVALPGGAFDGGALGSLELVRAIGGEACVAAVLAPDGRPAVSADVNDYACGHPEVVNGRIELHPRAGMDVITEFQVKDTAVVHPDVLDPLEQGDAVTANLRTLLALAAQGDDSWGCINHSATAGGTGSGGVQLDFRLCAVVDVIAADRIVARSVSTTDGLTFTVPGAFVDPAITPGVATPVIAWGFDGPHERYVQIAPYGGGGCL